MLCELPAAGQSGGSVMVQLNDLHMYKYIKHPLVTQDIPVYGLNNGGYAYGASGADNLNVRLKLDRARTSA